MVVFGKLDLMAANEGMEALLISILLLVLVILMLLLSVLALAAVVVKTDAALDVEIVQRRAMAAARQLMLIMLLAEAVCNYISGCSFLN